MATMQPAAPLQFPNIVPPSGLCVPPPTPVHQEKVARPCPQTQSDCCPPKDAAVPPSRQVPRLRAVVESQAFKNILVDEMDMMVSRAATVIQANWKGYRLRQKLISQMTAAKAIQEAWRRFSTRRLMRSNKLSVKKAKREEEGDIPYHPPQQVRFHAPEDQLPVMVSKETQFPSSDNLVPSHTTAAPGPCASGAYRGGLLPQQSVTGRLMGPKYPPCMLTKTVRSSCLIRHLEGDSVKSRQVASKTIRSGVPESAASGRYGQAVHGSLKTQTPVHTEADVPKVPPHMYPVNKTPTKVCPGVCAPKSPATVTTAPKGALQMYPTSPATVMKMQSPTCPTSPVTRPLAHVRPNPSLSNTTPQMRSVIPTARAQPPGCAVTSTVKTSPRPGAPVSKGPLQTGSGPVTTKTSPQMRPAARSQAQTCAAPTSSKTSSQSSPTAKPSPQTRLAAMITKTPAQIRSVAAVLRTLCLVPAVAASSPRGSPQTHVVAGMPNIPSQVHLNSPKAKVTVSTKQATAVVKVASHSYLAEGKGRCGPHGHLDTVVPKPPAKSSLEAEKMKPGPPKAIKKEAAPKTTAAIMTRALSWTKVTEDRDKPLTQVQQRAEVVKIHSRVYMPEETTVALSQAQLAVPLTKASTQAQPPPATPAPPPASPFSKAVSQSHTPSVLATGLPEGRRPPGGPSAVLPSSPLAAHLMSLTAQLQPAGEQTRPVPQAHLAKACAATASPQARSLGMAFLSSEGYQSTCPLTPTLQHHTPSHSTKSSLQLRLPAEHAKTANTKGTKATCQVCPPTKLSKAPSLAQLITCLAKAPSQAHLPVGAAKAQSQAQLTSETAKCLLTAHPATDLSSKTQSQPLLSTSKASVQFWQHFGTLNTGPRAKPDDRSVTQPQLHSHTQNKAVQSPRSVATDTQSTLVPLLTPSGHTACNADSWADSGRARTPPPPPVPSQAVSCHEDLAASIASLCADLVAMLGSPEDLRALLAKTLSQGEVRTALSQALSREVLGPSVVKALPQGMLGMALMKALSWGELGISLSRALSRGELRPELSKATQGKLAEVLCKALTEDERATLSQALCQGELGAVFTQSLAQMAQRTGAFLPKATSKTVGSRMTTAPAPVEVTCSGSLSVAWGPALGPVQARCSKGPVDAGLAAGQSWNSKVPNVSLRATARAGAPQGTWHPSRGHRPWDPSGAEAALDRKPSAELLVSVRAMEKVVVQAVITIQACARGYLVRRTVKVWHQWATIIQATWRGYRVRRNLARLLRATTIIQAAWRGYCIRRDRAHQVLLPATWPEHSGRAQGNSDTRSSSEHRCFLSCQPDVCSVCQSLGPRVESPPSVVMLVGSQPRTCHVCGHTLSTRVVQGFGQGVSGQPGSRWAAAPQHCALLKRQHRAATVIQAAWKGYRTRRLLNQQQSAAKTVQATWRGHYTRSCLTTDALLGTGGPWSISRDTSRRSSRAYSLHWPGV
ncbi:LOW QUALITY PROTEIN: IQ domain-containing protein N [Mesocricetus auratus]|uniref:LOW QUALITY PROTEIN: IQ domain-containing protein N n=1 Tax=Mesocricetus auratus TaxID=10036 RepID=A0A1U7RD33_MESAU|nr:LOW QUALITY PROTEIN: IQ domain-containing protein N [Mesocricetus auratus]